MRSAASIRGASGGCAREPITTLRTATASASENLQGLSEHSADGADVEELHLVTAAARGAVE